jgi:dihydrofolate reductase
MAKLQYQCTMSLDGFIAGPDGDVSWLVEYLGPNPAVDQIMQQTGALLVGNRTFSGGDPFEGTEHEGKPYGGGWDGPQFVLTHTAPDTAIPGVTFVTDLDRAVAAAKSAAGDKYVGVLGAQVAAQCIEAGILDEIFVNIAPVMVGDGTRMFSWPSRTNVSLERLRLTETPRVTSLVLQVVR